MHNTNSKLVGQEKEKYYPSQRHPQEYLYNTNKKSNKIDNNNKSSADIREVH